MKLLFVVNSLGIGGAEKMVVFVAKELKVRGHNCSIINLNINNKFDRSPEGELEVFNADIQYTGMLTTNFKWIKFVYDISKKERPDVIIGFAGLANFCVAATEKLLKIPSVICERNDPFRTFRHPSFSQRLKIRTINSATGAVFQTREAGEFYSKKLRKKSVVIANPIFINEDYSPIDYANLPKTIVSLGRFSNKQKRFDVLLKGFKEFHKKHVDYILNIYGSGPDEEYINSQIAALGIDNFVEVKGKTDTPLKTLSGEGIFAITSDYEGISNSLLEAMAVGLPVVSTDHTPGGARLLIEDHKNGLLIPTEDPHALSSALAEYAEKPELRFLCGTKAKNVINRFSPVKCIDSWESYLQSIIK